MIRRFHAPGKVVVLGEYAVLDGAPSLVCAVEHGVACTFEPGPTHQVRAPGDTRFVDAAFAAVHPPPGTWTFFDHPPVPTATKPGLGGSAAATVVATFAARTLLGLPTDPPAVFTQAEVVHRAVQGSGSGVDVAASTWGGMLRFTRGEAPAPAPPVPVMVVYSGRSASTGPRVRQYLNLAHRGWFVDRSRTLLDTWAADPVAALRASRDLLATMSSAAGIDWMTKDLRDICDLAEFLGGGAKPSGAGGGDCAVAVFPNPVCTARFAAEVRAQGWPLIASQPAAGVREIPSGDAL